MTRFSGFGDVVTLLETAARSPGAGSKDFIAIFSGDKWTANSNLHLLDTSSTESAPVVAHDSALICRVISSAFEVDTIVTMLKHILGTAIELQSRYNTCIAPIVRKLSKGLLSLPDELLATVFDFAVNADRGTSTKQAISLSHVSRRFRDAAFSARNLWTTLRSCDSDEIVNTVIARCGPTEGLHVILHQDGSRAGLEIQSFVEKIQHTSKRWKTISLGQETQVENSTVRADLHAGVELCWRKLQRFIGNNSLKLPKLEGLYIHGNNNVYIPALKIRLRWTTPNLRTLRCSYLLPSRSDIFSAVTTFVFSQSLSQSHCTARIQTLLLFLSSMQSLSTFELDLQFESRFAFSGNALSLSAFTCPTITTFRLCFRKVVLSNSMRHEGVIASVIQALAMPNLVALSISVGIQEIEKAGPGCTKPLHRLSNSLLPSFSLPESRAHLSSLSLKLWHEDTKASPFYAENTEIQTGLGPHIFPIPLNRIPNVSTVNLRACTRISFTQDDDVGEAPWKETYSLSNINFVCCKDADIEDLRFTVQSLKEIGAWDSIADFAVEDCHRRLRREDV